MECLRWPTSRNEKSERQILQDLDTQRVVLGQQHQPHRVWLEMQALGLHLDLQEVNLHFSEVSQVLPVHSSV